MPLTDTTENLDEFASLRKINAVDTAPKGDARQIVYKNETTPPNESTVREILDETIYSGVLEEIEVTATGGLGVSWTAGKVYTPAGDIVETESGSGTCADDAVCYLVWTTGTTLTLRTTPADVATEVDVAHFAVGDTEIRDSHQEPLITESMPQIVDGLASLFPTVVTSGCLVSEDADATNPLDVSVSTGVFWHEGHNKHSLTGFDTRTASTLVRCNIDGAGPSWNFVDSQDEVDFTQWNSGTSLVATATAKYYRGLFVVSEDNVYWIYAQEQHNTLAAAELGNDPTIPAGLENFPKSIAYIYKDGDTVFQAAGDERWIDVRPLLASSPAATAGGIQNVVEDNTPQLGGALDALGNDITSIGDIGFDGSTGLIKDSDGNTVAQVSGGTGVVNYIALEATTTGKHPKVRAIGGDPDVDVVLLPAGAGNIDASGVAITNVGNVDGRDVSVDGTLLDLVKVREVSFQFLNPTSTHDFLLDGVPAAATITECFVHLNGGTSVTFVITRRARTDPFTGGTVILADTALASDTDGDTKTVTESAYTADTVLRMIIGTVTGVVTEMLLTLKYTIDVP